MIAVRDRTSVSLEVSMRSALLVGVAGLIAISALAASLPAKAEVECHGDGARAVCRDDDGEVITRRADAFGGYEWTDQNGRPARAREDAWGRAAFENPADVEEAARIARFNSTRHWRNSHVQMGLERDAFGNLTFLDRNGVRETCRNDGSGKLLCR
jgi:hypothetical protein